MSQENFRKTIIISLSVYILVCFATPQKILADFEYCILPLSVLVFLVLFWKAGWMGKK